MLWSHSSDVTWLRYTAYKQTSSKCSGWNVRKTVSLNSRKSNFSILSQIQIGCAKNGLTRFQKSSINPGLKVRLTGSPVFWVSWILEPYIWITWRHRNDVLECIGASTQQLIIPCDVITTTTTITTSDVIVCEKLIFGSVVRKTTSGTPKYRK